jgi:hypothetical protein
MDNDVGVRMYDSCLGSGRPSPCSSESREIGINLEGSCVSNTGLTIVIGQ